MPKIKVNETDLSWYYRQRALGSLIIMMPGVSSWGPHDPVYVDQSNFTKVLGDKVVHQEDLSYPMAASFVRAGATVLFVRIPLESEATASFTSDDGSVTVSAKYPGSFGNNLELKTISTEVGYRVVVYSNGNVLESFIVDFKNPASEYYYLNQSHDYVKFTVDTAINVDITLPDKIVLSGGADGNWNHAAIAKAISDDDRKVFVELCDPLTYDFHIIVSGGYNNIPAEATDISAVDKKLRDIAVKRGTAIYLVDGDLVNTNSSEKFQAYVGLPKTAGADDVAGFNTSYAAAYGPWCYAKLLSTGAVRLLPGSYSFLIGWCNSIANGSPLWLAPAGVKRATLSFVTSTAYPVGQAVLDLWQPDETLETQPNSFRINPIMNLKQYGYVVYGNSTLLHTGADGASSMLQSFSTRILANLIKIKAFETSLSLQFDQVDDELFAEFNVRMTTFMDALKYGGALYDYDIVADRSALALDDLNSRTVPVKIKISPNPAAENFVIDLEISQAGVTFSDDAESESDE